jgi:hypothetical protein
MASQINVSYYYTNSIVRSQLDACRRVSGEPEKVMVNQIIKNWLDLHRKHYLDVAARDCFSRDIKFDAWAKIVFYKGFPELERLHPILSVRHSSSIDKLNDKLHDTRLKLERNRSHLNHLTFGVLHTILFKVVQHYSGDTLIDTISKIVQYTMNQNWIETYAPQVRYESFDNWVLPDYLQDED